MNHHMNTQKYPCASICDRLPTQQLSANHPWLVDYNLKDDSRNHIIYTTYEPFSQSRFQIPPSLGKRIRGCSYGWVILSNHPQNNMWSLWNPVTSEIIRLPRLISKKPNINITRNCCLSSPPDDHGSVFMLTANPYAIVFCRLDRKRNKLKWVEISYAKQMRKIVGHDSFLYNITSCDGKVYALTSASGDLLVVHIDIVVKGGETAIRLLPYLEVGDHYLNGCMRGIPFLVGCCTGLYYIELGLLEAGHITKETLGDVHLSKLDTTNIRWEVMDDIKDVTFFLDEAHGSSVFYSAAIPSKKLGGHVHFLDSSGKVIHSYDSKSKTIAFSSMPTSHALSSKHSLHVNQHGEIKPGGDSQHTQNDQIMLSLVNDCDTNSNSTGIETGEENMEARLLNIPLDLLKTIMEFCVGVEYLNFRATCKLCQSAAPMIRWSKGGRLQTYSLDSPWLMVLHKERGVISFSDPMLGDRYFIKTPLELIGDLEIHCCMYGWLLIRVVKGPLLFFNPFTGDIHKLPLNPHLDTYCFSAPPTSSDCMVVGFATQGVWPLYIHFVHGEPSWHRFHLNCSGVYYSRYFRFATHYGRSQSQYALYNNGGLGFIDTEDKDYIWQEEPTSSCMSPQHNFLVKCDQQLLLVIVGELGESVEVFKLNDLNEWETTMSLGTHTIYVCDSACLCIEAKTPGMANKIYFPRLHSENGKILFYSLKTRRYHTTFNGSEDMEESIQDFMGTERHLDPHVWIEPSWSKVY